MARKPSSIFDGKKSAEDKKEQTTTARTTAKEAKAQLAALTKERATVDRDHAKLVKSLEADHKKALAEAVKAYNVIVKESDKALRAAKTSLERAELSLTKITGGPKAKPTETD